MYLTEKEAQEKWCPFSRAAIVETALTDSGPRVESVMTAGVTVNRDAGSDLDAVTCCVASRCMAWRQVEPNTTAKPMGYCGLAGNPYPAYIVNNS